MQDAHDLQLILSAGPPLVVIETHDEPRLLSMLVDLAIRAPAKDYRPIFRWTVTDGLQRLDIDLEPQQHNAEPEDVLRHIRAVDKPGIYILLDFHPYLQDPVNVRLLKDICLGFSRSARSMILVSHRVELPAELERFTARFDLALPSDVERAAIVRRAADDWAQDNPGSTVAVDKKAFDLLVRNLAGLTVSDTERLARKAIYHDGAISKSDLPRVMEAKYELLSQSSVLSYEYETAGFADLGGMKALKRWLEHRRPVFLGQGGTEHLDAPKGVLLIGVQGCGKSLAAKAAAGVYGVPLLRLDFGSLYAKYYGESERNLRESLKTAEVMAPCVLWTDEIEKGIASDQDQGVSRRVLGTFLTWLAEKSAEVFVVATANDISALPAELVRKGRFDEIFFVDLPDPRTRAEILGIHLRQRNLDPAQLDLASLVATSNGFSGAEIEQAVVSALYAAHASEETLAASHILDEMARTRPLSVVMKERVDALRTWADGRTVRAN